MNRAFWTAAAAVFLAVVASCNEEDPRLAQLAQENVRQQAGQNREMSQLNREVAQAHQDLIGLQQNVEQRQAEVDRQRDQLEAERRKLAEQWNRAPVIAAAIDNVGLMLACLILDLPTATQKQAIWRIYLELFGLDAAEPKPLDADWTGAEIRSCCRRSWRCPWSRRRGTWCPSPARRRNRSKP